jgi:hypothetical protein
MAINRKSLHETIKKRVLEKEELVPGYQKELLKTINDIILEESSHLERRTNIQKIINELIDHLGTFVREKKIES